MTLKLGVAAHQTLPANSLAGFVRLVERLGYDQFWYSNHKMHRDMYVNLAVAATASSRMELGTFIADPYSLHPALAAAAVATLDELSGGRMIFAVGAGGHGFGALGIDRRQPARTLTDAVRVVKGLLAGEAMTIESPAFRCRSVSLAFEPRPRLPVIVASRGDRVLEAAGACADGAMLATYATPPGVRHGLEMIRRGAAASGRRLEDLRVISRVDVSLSENRAAARNAVKPMIAGMLLASYPDTAFVDLHGLRIPPALEEILARKDLDRAWSEAHLVPDSFVDCYAWAGTAGEVAEQVARVIEAGISEITFLPHPAPGESDVTTVTAFARDVWPRVRSLIGV